jgi:hypothetical protein
MESLLTYNGKSIKGTAFCSCFIPNKFLPLLGFHHLSSIEALHFFALTAKNRGIQTGIEIVFMDVNG